MKPPPRPSPVPPHPGADNSFWDATETLGYVRRWADYQLVSPWSLLGSALVDVAAADSWLHWLPGLAGDKEGATSGSLYAVAVAPKGGGKSVSAQVARSMLRIRGSHLAGFMNGRNLKSPEGIYDLYERKVEVETGEEGGDGEPATRWEIRQTEWQSVVRIDEIGAVLKVVGRSGNWLAEAYSQWFTGYFPPNDTMSTARPGLARNTHLSMYAGGQDHLVAGVMSGEGAEQGFSARLVLFDGLYPDLRDVGPEKPRRISVTLPKCDFCPPCQVKDWKGATALQPELYAGRARIWEEVPRVQKDVALARKRALRGEEETGHDNLVRRRLAKHLAVLHSSDRTTLEWWELSGRVMDHSRNLADYLVENLPAFLERANLASDVSSIIRNTAIRNQPVNTERACAAALRRLHRRHPGGEFLVGDINRVLSGHERTVLQMNGKGAGSPSHQVLAYFLAEGLVTYEGQERGETPKKGATFQFVPEYG